MILKSLDAAEAESDDSWAAPYTIDFRKRMLNLLQFEFSSLSSSLALQIVNPSIKAIAGNDENNEDQEAINSIKKVC